MNRKVEDSARPLVERYFVMRPDRVPERLELRCYPCEGGFEIWLSAPIGSSYWIEYCALGGGGYQESGEITGTISSWPELVRRAVGVPVIEVAITSMSLGAAVGAWPRPASTGWRALTPLERRPVPQAEVQTAHSGEGNSELPEARTK
jgi:hypothetical protein